MNSPSLSMESVLQNPDLLMAILSVLLQSRPIVSSFYRTSVHLTLTQVCPLWRDLITKTPMFWTHIQFYCNKSDSELAVRQNLLVEMWLERSKNLPFSLILLEITRKNHTRPPYIPPQILQHSHRFHYLHLNMSIPFLYNLLSSQEHPDSAFCFLKSITITHSKRIRRSLNEEAPTFEFHQFAGSLTAVTTIRMMMGEMVFSWMLLFNPSRLTTLDLVPSPCVLDFPLSVEKALSVLRQCPGLQEARLLCIDGDSSLADNLAIIHKSLRTLALYEPSQGRPTVGHILENLTTPLLHSLSITSMMEDLTLDAWRLDQFCSAWSMSRMMDFISRLSAPLQELRLKFPSKELDISLIGDILAHNPFLLAFSCSSKFTTFSNIKFQGILDAIKCEGKTSMTPKSLYFWYNTKTHVLTISSERLWRSEKLLETVIY